ncbi:MAG TPA: hypothetical protein VGG39_07190 [Polyangiaceae bacterium]|jgi:hypothetical protein
MNTFLRFTALASMAAAAALAGGCTLHENPASMQDDFASDVLAPLLGNGNGLSTPYVLGAKFNVTLEAGGGGSTAGWTLVSSDPSVLEVETQGGGSTSAWPVMAAGSGHTTLSVVDGSGKTLDSEGVDVAAPASAQLCAHGLLLAGESEAQAAVPSVEMLAGGTAAFLVRYFGADGHELAGNSGATPSATGAVTSSLAAASFSARDFLVVGASQAGTGTVTLDVGSFQLQVPVDAVQWTTVEKVAYAAQSESGAQSGATLWVYGRALDAQGADVFGASFTWQANGVAIAAPSPTVLGGPTDLVSYAYDPSQEETLTVVLQGDGEVLQASSASLQVHATPGTTTEQTAAQVGCSVAGGAAGAGGSTGGLAGTIGATLLGLAAAVAVARRRRG